MRSMTPEEINAFVRQQIELASSRKSSTTPTQQTRRMRLARTPSPMSRFGRTNPLLFKPGESKTNAEDSRSAELSLDELFQRNSSTTARDLSDASSIQPHGMPSGRPTLSTEDEKRSLSVDRQRQSSSPDRRDGITDSPVQFDYDAGRKARVEKPPCKDSELQIVTSLSSPKKATPGPEYGGSPVESSASPQEESVTIRRRSSTQMDRKLKKAARNKASRRRADLFTATTSINASESEPFDENDQYSQISDTSSTLFDSALSQKTRELLKETRDISAREKKYPMSQPQIDSLIKQSISKARQARKIASDETDPREPEQKTLEPRSRFDELTGMSPLGGRSRRFSWSSVEDLDDASTLDGVKSPKAAHEVSEGEEHRATEMVYSPTRSDMLATRMRLRSSRLRFHQAAETSTKSKAKLTQMTEPSMKPSGIFGAGNSEAAHGTDNNVGEGNQTKLRDGLRVSTEPCASDARSPLNLPSITSDRIYSQDEISAIVLLSMEKAQQAARDEIRSLLLTPKATDPKSPIAAKLAARLRVPSQEEVTSIAREAMHRAREAAQEEIRTLIRESFRCAQDSSQEQIRQIVRDSMQRARASAREEMSELVRNILRQGMDDQQKNHLGNTVIQRNPEMVAAEKLLISKDRDHSVTDSLAPTNCERRPSSPSNQKCFDDQKLEENQTEKQTVFSPDKVKRATEGNGGEVLTSTDPPTQNASEEKIRSLLSEEEKSLIGSFGLDLRQTPKSKFSFSQVDTQDDDPLLPPPESSVQSCKGNDSPVNQLFLSKDDQVQPVSDEIFASTVHNSNNQNVDCSEISPTTRESSCGNHSPHEASQTSISFTKGLEEVAESDHAKYSPPSFDTRCTHEEKIIENGNHEIGGDSPEVASSLGAGGLVSLVESVNNNAIEAFAADSSMIALNDEHSTSASEEFPVDNNRKVKQPAHRSNVKHRRKTRIASSKQHVSGTTRPPMTSSDASTHSSSSASADDESSSSSASQLRRRGRKNRYRSSNNEAVVTDEFLQLIASKKGKRITAKDLGELIQQQQVPVRSPQAKKKNRHAKSRSTGTNNIRDSQSFVTRPRPSFEKQPPFCMVTNFMNFWEDFDLFLDDEGSDYHGNEILSFSTRGESYTDFDDDDFEATSTEEAPFDPNIAVSFSLQPSEDDDSYLSEEELPRRRGWW